jgi:cysteine synthase A
MRIFDSVFDLVGNTPMIKMDNIFCKCECLNPTGSVKDRVIKAILREFLDSGQLERGMNVVMASSGLSALSLAALGASVGVNVIITATDNIDETLKTKIASYGAEIILIPAEKGMKSAIQVAENTSFGRHNTVYINHFEDEIGIAVHRDYTAVEIWQDMGGEVDIFVAGVGTGATIMGVSDLLRRKNKNIQIIAVEPEESAVLSGKAPGKHGIPGLGAGFIPPLYKTGTADRIFTVPSQKALKISQIMKKTFGIPLSVSSGAIFCAAKEIAADKKSSGQKIVALLPG